MAEGGGEGGPAPPMVECPAPPLPRQGRSWRCWWQGPLYEGPCTTRVRALAAGAEDGDVAGLGGAFDRHELEEARMLEASMLGIPYEPQLPVRCVACGGAPCPTGGLIL